MINKTCSVLLCFAFVVGARCDIWRPCESECNDDETMNSCVSKYFADNSECCTNVSGVVPFPFVVPFSPLQIPYYNLTFDRYNNKINGDGTSVEDLFIDMDTDDLYLTVNFDNITDVGDNYLTYYQPGKPDKYFESESYEYYPNIKVTIKIPCSRNLQFEKRQARAFISAVPQIDVGDGFRKFAKSDKDVHRLLNTITHNSNTPFIQEAFVHRAQVLGDLSINNMFCKMP